MPDENDLPPVRTNLPMPAPGAANRRNRYGLERLRVGEAIDVPLDQSELIRSAANNYRIFHRNEGWRYATRRQEIEGEMRFVLWRIA